MHLEWIRRPDVLTVMTSAPTYVATSEALRAVRPMDLTAFRFLAAALILGVFLLVRRQRLLLRPRDLWKVVAIAAIGYTTYGALLNIAQTTVPAGTASLLLNISPVFAFVLGYLVLGERIKKRAVIGLLVAVIGVMVVTVFGGGELGFDWNALVLLAASLVLAVFLIAQQPLLARVPPVEMVFWGCLFGGLFALPLAPFDVQPGAWELRTWVAVVVLVTSSTALAYSLWNISLASTSVAEGGSLLLAIPLFSITLGWLLLDQVTTPGAVVGGLIAVGGVVLINSGDKDPHRPHTEGAVTIKPVDEEVIALDVPEVEEAMMHEAIDTAIDRVGARLATVSMWRPKQADLVRVYTSMPEVYRLGGVSADLGEEWVDRCVHLQQSYMATAPADLESDAFEHQDTLAALRLGAGINAVITVDGRFLGCLNLMDGPGSYTPSDLRAADEIAGRLTGVLVRLSASLGARG